MAPETLNPLASFPDQSVPPALDCPPYNPTMEWFHAHRLFFGLSADSLTFIGGVLLARDAFRKLKDLKESRIDSRFRDEFPRLNLTDDEWSAASRSLHWSLAGFVMLTLGFAAQLVLRFLEP